jgi:hypothetical protein
MKPLNEQILHEVIHDVIEVGEHARRSIDEHREIQVLRSPRGAPPEQEGSSHEQENQPDPRPRYDPGRGT